MKKITLSIGIPAYNEGLNIGHLLISIFNQKVRNCILEEVIIISDGSTDNTVAAVKKINDKRIILIDRKNRNGQNTSQNEIVKRAKGDVLVLLNADVLLVGDDFLDQVALFFLKNKKVGLIGVETKSARPQNFVERVLGNSHVYKTSVYKMINNGSNVYLCYGAARAFTKDLYKQIKWPKDCPEDSYSYFFALEKNFNFSYVPKAKVIFRSPSTINDHIKQSKRFKEGLIKIEALFGKDIVYKEFYIPKTLAAIVFLRLLPKRVLSLPSYIVFQIYTSLASGRYKKFRDTYDVAQSTKKLVSYSAIIYALVDKL